MLVSVVAPSEGGGVIASEVVVAGELPLSAVPLTTAELDAAARSFAEPEPTAGPSLAVLGETDVVVTVGVAVLVRSSAGLVMIGAVEVTSTVVGTVVVVVDVTVSVVGTVTGWMVVVVVVTVVAVGAEVIGAVEAEAVTGWGAGVVIGWVGALPVELVGAVVLEPPEDAPVADVLDAGEPEVEVEAVSAAR